MYISKMYLILQLDDAVDDIFVYEIDAASIRSMRTRKDYAAPK